MAAPHDTTPPSSVSALARVKLTSYLTGLIFAALLIGSLFATPFTLLSRVSTGVTSNLLEMAGTAFSFIGMGVVVFAYLKRSGRSLDYIDYTPPSLDTVKYIGIGAGASILIMVGFNIAVLVFDLPLAEGVTQEMVGTELYMVLLFGIIVVLFNAPVEELLFRNTVQKRFSEAFSVTAAIILTSLIFAFVHLPSYLAVTTIDKAVVPLIVIFTGSLVFGYIYAKSNDILVPIGAHAIYNLLQLAVYMVTVL